ncbi:pulmonary surfactant-associated protein A-like [Phlebotomus argentipes]|uniref:pulmonary surfactant-associated protein A-like n=1 Tax=Phlebotomus argentipes TaxID=94469 RepID=UPI0028934793|nr:pulmonary surfactant-associated protein A-like [Phlebotomus argentipes]
MKLILVLLLLIKEYSAEDFNTISLQGKIIHISTEMVDWYGATDKCGENQWEMLTIKSPEENTAVHQIIKDFPSDVLIGGYRFDGEKTWHWANDRRAAVNYSNWQQGEPKLDTSEEPRIYCIYMQPSDGQWKSQWCAEEAPFICQDTQYIDEIDDN